MPDTQVDLLDWSLQKVHWQILDDVLNNALKYGKKKLSSSQKEFFFREIKSSKLGSSSYSITKIVL